MEEDNSFLPTHIKVFLILIVVAAIALMLSKLLSPIFVTTPDIQKAEESREKHIEAAKELEPIHDIVYRDRFKVKHHYDTIIKEVLALDTSSKLVLFRQLYPSIDSANVTYYHAKSAIEQLSKMDSLYVVDSLIIGHLKSANKSCDTIIQYWQTKAGKQYWKGFRHGTVTGYVIGEVKNILIKR